MLEDDNSSMKHAKILSIVGFGGLGKTTLENEVYRRIKGHFQCHGFVSVSQKPDVKTIIKDMISQITSCEEKDFKEDIDDTWDIKKCITKLRELLQDKR
jgi:uridine kinase